MLEPVELEPCDLSFSSELLTISHQWLKFFKVISNIGENYKKMKSINQRALLLTTQSL